MHRGQTTHHTPYHATPSNRTPYSHAHHPAPPAIPPHQILSEIKEAKKAKKDITNLEKRLEKARAERKSKVCSGWMGWDLGGRGLVMVEVE